MRTRAKSILDGFSQDNNFPIRAEAMLNAERVKRAHLR
jgi:hypothetical protein